MEKQNLIVNSGQELIEGKFDTELSKRQLEGTGQKVLITGAPNSAMVEYIRQLKENGLSLETEGAINIEGLEGIPADVLDNLVILDEQSMLEGFPEGVVTIDSIPEMRSPAISMGDLNLVQKMQMASMYGEFGDFPEIRMSREERRKLQREEARKEKKLRKEMSKQIKQQGHDPQHDFFSIDERAQELIEVKEASING